MSVPEARRSGATFHSTDHLNRRRFISLSAAGVAVAGGSLLTPGLAAAGTPGISEAAPIDRVFVPMTGHHLHGPLLTWWLQHGRERVIGWPITEQIAADGETRQYFEYGALRIRTDVRDPIGAAPIDLGEEWLARVKPNMAAEGAVDTRSAFWMWRTQRGVNPDFWPPFRDGGGAFAYGYPITWAFKSSGQLTQVFKRARMTLTADGPVFDKIGLEEAERLEIPTESVTRDDDIPVYRAYMFAPDYGPIEARWADIDIPKQITTFYAGDTPVYVALIASGIAPNYTPIGEWKIWKRVQDEWMVGGAPGTSDYYNLRNVYFTQYFTSRYAAFHYAYWHDEFGRPQSHGCANMRLEDSRWAWHFLGEGSTVKVHN